jgi:hypothetical protein
MTIKKEDSQLADKDGNPLIGSAQATIANPAAVVGLANNAAVATLVALKTELENTNARLTSVIAALKAHGLIK